ncbi:MAG: DUF4423 domain-containing protein [Polyangiaceae bacterium]
MCELSLYELRLRRNCQRSAAIAAGKRSQPAFSRRLGYKTNVAYTWEAARAFPTAAQTFHAAERVGIDVRDALSRFYRTPPGWLASWEPNSSRGVAELLNDLRGRTSVVELARAAARSRFAVARWLKGSAEPRLPDFLLLVEKTSLRLLDFLASFVDPTQLPSVARAWEQLEATRRAAVEVPWTQAVLRALELTDYQKLEKHQRGWLARRIGISLEEEQRCLRLLSQTGQIRLRAGRWELRQVLAVDTRRDAKAELGAKIWWTEQALSRLGSGQAGIFSYNVFAVSAADFARINDLYRAYFRQVRSIIAQSEPSERVVLATLQLLQLDSDEPPPGRAEG